MNIPTATRWYVGGLNCALWLAVVGNIIMPNLHMKRERLIFSVIGFLHRDVTTGSAYSVRVGAYSNPNNPAYQEAGTKL